MQRRSLSSASLDSEDHPASAALHRATQTTAQLLRERRTPSAAYTPSQNGVYERALTRGSRGDHRRLFRAFYCALRQSTPSPSRTLAAPSLSDCRRLSSVQYRYRRSFVSLAPPIVRLFIGGHRRILSAHSRCAPLLAITAVSSRALYRAFFSATDAALLVHSLVPAMPLFLRIRSRIRSLSALSPLKSRLLLARSSRRQSLPHSIRTLAAP